MSDIHELNDALAARDAVEQSLLPYFAAFATASRRAAKVHKPSTKKEEPTEEAATNTQETAEDDDIVEQLKDSRHNLERQLRTLQIQLDKSQERARAVAEEQYLKTSAVQGLHDEILALTVQLNLSEERRKKLQDELGR